MESADVAFQMVKCTKDTSKMIIKKDMEEVYIIIKVFIKVNFRKEKSMERENLFSRTEKRKMDFGKMINLFHDLRKL